MRARQALSHVGMEVGRLAACAAASALLRWKVPIMEHCPYFRSRGGTHALRFELAARRNDGSFRIFFFFFLLSLSLLLSPLSFDAISMRVLSGFCQLIRNSEYSTVKSTTTAVCVFFLPFLLLGVSGSQGEAVVGRRMDRPNRIGYKYVLYNTTSRYLLYSEWHVLFFSTGGNGIIMARGLIINNIVHCGHMPSRQCNFA